MGKDELMISTSGDHVVLISIPQASVRAHINEIHRLLLYKQLIPN